LGRSVADALPTRFRLRAGNLDTALRYEAVLRLLAERWRPGVEVLEVGSGSGGVTEFLAYPVTGVDPAFERTAERSTEFLRRVPGRATALPLDDASFDLVLCVEVVEHLAAEEREPALAEMVRVLRPGGRLVLTFPADATAAALDRWLDDAYRARHGVPHPWVAEHLAEGVPRTDDVVAALRRAGGPGARAMVRKHQPALAFKALHGVYTVYGGTVWTGRFALGSPPAVRAAFSLLRRMRRGPAYRTVLVLDKP
jgi:SAM-dependent methyltransferase